MSDVISFKAGNTFKLNCTMTNEFGVPVDINGWTITSKIYKRSPYSEIGTLDVAITNAAAGQYTITKDAATTQSWPISRALMDIKYQDGDGFIVSSETLYVDVVRGVT